MAGFEPAEVTAALAADGVNAPSGTFYAIEPAGWLGLPPTGATRVGMAPYTNQSDIDRLVLGVERLTRPDR